VKVFHFEGISFKVFICIINKNKMDTLISICISVVSCGTICMCCAYCTEKEVEEENENEVIAHPVVIRAIHVRPMPLE